MKPKDYFRRLIDITPQIEAHITQAIVAVESQKFYTGSFRKRGFTDQSFVAWKKRDNDEDEDDSRALLVKTGAMRRQAKKGYVRGNHVDFVFSLPYMRVHNEGLKAGRGKGFTMPKRQYIGTSATLNKIIHDKAIKFLNRKLKK